MLTQASIKEVSANIITLRNELRKLLSSWRICTKELERALKGLQGRLGAVGEGEEGYTQG